MLRSGRTLSRYRPLGINGDDARRTMTMAKTSPLTPTSYALLGLLAVQPWTTYELAKQVDRTMNRFWPRAKSKLYEEPKKLVAHGESKPNDKLAAPELAAYTLVANTILNLDETLTRN